MTFTYLLSTSVLSLAAKSIAYAAVQTSSLVATRRDTGMVLIPSKLYSADC